MPALTPCRGYAVQVEGNLTFRSFMLLLFTMMLGSFGQVFLKRGMPPNVAAHSTSLWNTLLAILQAMLNPYVILGLVLYVLSVLTWIILLSKVRLSVIYPMISTSYPVVVVLSALILKEHVRWLYAVGGLIMISAGVSFIGLGLGQSAGKAGIDG